MNIELVINVTESLKNKPSEYHYLCWAGTVTKAVDCWGENPLLKCHYYGIGYGMREKGCTYTSDKGCCCKGLIRGDYELTERERTENYAIDQVVRKLIEVFKDGK